MDQVYSALEDGLLFWVILVGIGDYCMNMLNTVDKTSTTDRLDVKMSKKAEICKGTHWEQDNIEGYDLTWLNEKVVPDSRCYCWETNRLTVEVVEWGPRIYEIETNYKTLKVIGHWSDFEVKILYRSSSLSKIILYRESNGK